MLATSPPLPAHSVIGQSFPGPSVGTCDAENMGPRCRLSEGEGNSQPNALMFAVTLGGKRLRLNHVTPCFQIRITFPTHFARRFLPVQSQRQRDTCVSGLRRGRPRALRVGLLPSAARPKSLRSTDLSFRGHDTLFHPFGLWSELV